MEILSERIEAYERQLAKLREESRRYVFARFRAAQANGLIKSDDDALQVAHDALAEARQAYGDQAARAAADMYDATVAELGHDVEMAELDNDFTDDEIWAQVRTARKASRTADDFIRHMANFAYDKTYNAARKTTARNAERDHDKGVRYARIPTGRETCGWCVMLASRGFVYHSRKSAGDYGGRFNYFHDKCDCRVQVGDENTTVKGYDPDWYLKVYEDAREACGSGDPKDIANEINRRNNSWVYRKEPGSISSDPGATPDEVEMAAAKLVSSHGLDVVFKPRSLKHKQRRADTRIGKLRWEIKSPAGNGKLTVYNQFKSVVYGENKHERNPQAPRVVISNVRSDMSFSKMVEDAEKVMESGEFPEIIEALILGRDGEIRRIKKSR